MALSPCHDSSKTADVSRSRSYSFSTETSTNYLYQEVFADGKSALVRSFSCGQVFKKRKSGETVHSTRIQVHSFVSPIKRLKRSEEAEFYKCWSAPIPVKKRYPRSTKAKTRLAFLDYPKEVKFLTRDKESKEDCNERQFLGVVINFIKSILLVFITVLIAMSADYVIKQKKCTQPWDIHKTAFELKSTVFGQEKVVNDLIKILEQFSESHDSSVISFLGSIGVGKTFVSSIIYKNFPWPSNGDIFFYDSQLKENLKLPNYSNSCANIVIVDGIDFKDAVEAVDIITKFIHSFDGHKKFLVIMIVQVHHANDAIHLSEYFQTKGLYFHTLFFNTLKENDIISCFRAELIRQNKSVSNETLSRLVTESMLPCNITKNFHGCKKVFHEVSLI